MNPTPSPLPASAGHLRRAWLLPLVVAAAMASGTAEESRPNLVFVWADQLSADMVGAYGNHDVQTPNLDRFAREGVRFEHGISNQPVCTPYRSILLSGQHPLRNGAFQNDLQMLPGQGRYFGEVLRDGGLHTGYYGKWHLYGGDRNRGIPPGPFRYGFDDEFLTNNCTLAFFPPKAIYWSQDGTKKLHYDDWEPYAQTRQAMDFIDRHAHERFALFLSWHPPHNAGNLHAGYNAPEDLLKLYDPARVHLRPTIEDTPVVREQYQGYMANITGVDRAFGWLMQKLKDKGVADNTIVVFTADHGDLLGSYHQRNHKSRPEDIACRVPMLIRWPAGLKPSVSPLLFGTFDLMPTLLGLMHLPVPSTCDGRDVSSALVAGRGDEVDALPLLSIEFNWRGVYTPRYTYAEAIYTPTAAERARPPYNAEQTSPFDTLYDRQADPEETRNLFDDPAYADLHRRLHERTHAFMAHYGDKGIPYHLLLTQTVREGDLTSFLLPLPQAPKGWEGKLKGRPLDLQRAQPNPAAANGSP